MLENSTVLVTGGAGFIGSHIVEEVLKSNPKKVIVYDNLSEGRVSNLPNDKRIELVRRDIRDIDDLHTSMYGVDFVFHTASTLLLESRDRPSKAIDVNIKGTYNVIKSAAETSVRKIIFSSSGSVYGQPLYVPMDEDHPYNSELLYGTTKITGEHLLKDWYKSHGLPFVALRYFNIYGPRQHYIGAYAQIIPKWIDNIEVGEPIVIYGDGSQSMDMTYVTDVARANVLALESNATHDFINIGTGKEWTILQLSDIMKEIVGEDLQIEFVPKDVSLVTRRQCSTEKAEKLIDFKYQIDIRTGLRSYWNWRQLLLRKRNGLIE